MNSINAQHHLYPFTAIVGQHAMKQALLLSVVNPMLGGVLVKGEKGTAKSTAVRALADLLPELKVVNLPVSATEDRLVGTLDIEHAIRHGEKKFEPGLLAEAHGHILYVDEINLLEDHLVDVLLDASAMGVNTVEREGISFSHPSRFILIGTMNPEEGELRPQLLDRFALSVEVGGERDVEGRAEVVRRRLLFESDPASFCGRYEQEQSSLLARINRARELLPRIPLQDRLLERAAELSIRCEVDGHRADITMIKTAMTMAAWDGRTEASEADIWAAARFVLPHRLRKRPFEEREGADVWERLIEETSFA
ncbi:Magnesium-chelatase 38 kDa subunit [Paenibacillus konkukensis]|uniref:Magnesium-chelatase 38 kDa subunit n=1 Tax=Paenibacillus konkukensis TaxID=2020716 RepID=A0ABY4RH74_9BACL|nr:AAA family ATPase [Paenibacillus konkukensis]UQZ81542.1 Magnesium-chelatase 38 kDa subunit [Paenibacillus konkukensis]